MAVTVKMATAARPFEWHTDKDGAHALMFSNTLVLRIEKDGMEYDCCVNFQGRDDIPGGPCFRCGVLSEDGSSVDMDMLSGHLKNAFSKVPSVDLWGFTFEPSDADRLVTRMGGV